MGLNRGNIFAICERIDGIPDIYRTSMHISTLGFQVMNNVEKGCTFGIVVKKVLYGWSVNGMRERLDLGFSS